MLRWTDLDATPDAVRPCVATLGNFDGVHKGHRAVLAKVVAEAAERGVASVALTFEPHPLQVLYPDRAPDLIAPGELRDQLLGQVGLDGLLVLPFTREFAALSAETFVTEVLEANLAISHAVTGFDFHFGKDRQGGPAYLMAAGECHGFGVTLVDAFRDEGAEVISSSRIRALLTQGETAEAAGLLGYRYTVESEVIGGQQLGRTLGFPTANMRLSPEATLKEGIYAVRFRRGDGSLHDGVASFGRRPTVDDNGAPLLETFLFDFSGDLYGEVCEVSFFGYLRDEEKFDGLDALVAQIRRDEQEARALLAGVRPLSRLDAMVCF